MLRMVTLLVFAPLMFSGISLSVPAALNADNVGDWSALFGVNDLGTAGDDPFDLPVGYGQIPITTVSMVTVDSASPYSIPDSTDALVNNSDAPVTMAFPGVYGVGFYIANQFAGAYTATIQAFDASNHLLDDFDFPFAGGTQFIGVLDSVNDIASLTISTTQNTTDDAFVLGNISVNQQAGPPVPEPGTLLLSASAVGSIAWRSGRRRASNQGFLK